MVFRIELRQLFISRLLLRGLWICVSWHVFLPTQSNSRGWPILMCCGIAVVSVQMQDASCNCVFLPCWGLSALAPPARQIFGAEVMTRCRSGLLGDLIQCFSNAVIQFCQWIDRAYWDMMLEFPMFTDLFSWGISTFWRCSIWSPGLLERSQLLPCETHCASCNCTLVLPWRLFESWYHVHARFLAQRWWIDAEVGFFPDCIYTNWLPGQLRYDDRIPSAPRSFFYRSCFYEKYIVLVAVAFFSLVMRVFRAGTTCVPDFPHKRGWIDAEVGCWVTRFQFSPTAFMSIDCQSQLRYDEQIPYAPKYFFLWLFCGLSCSNWSSKLLDPF